MNDNDKTKEKYADVFEVIEPSEWRIPFVFASPHSGSDYPKDFVENSKLDFLSLRRSEDCYVDEIFCRVTGHGAPLLRAKFPRAYVDPNREPWELDPEMFEAPLPDYVNTTSPRVRGGLGTIAKLVTDGEEIYQRALSFAEAKDRVDNLYQPYHDKLAELIKAAKDKFGFCILIDCHSMPSVGGPMDQDKGTARTDFVLGDRFGMSCASGLTEAADAFLSGQGYNVVRNDPYAGGFTTHDYGKPEQGVHALQIEINRQIYMDEMSYDKRPGFDDMVELMDSLVDRMNEEAKTISPKTDLLIRRSNPDDLAEITRIYGHYVAETTVNFEEEPPPQSELTARRDEVLELGLPHLVAEVGGQVVGFAYAAPFRRRSAYRYTIESSIYLGPDHVRKGYGRALLSELITQCTDLGYKQMIAVIGDSANESSQALHASLGFRKEGTLRKVGRKFGRWIDVVIMHKELDSEDT